MILTVNEFFDSGVPVSDDISTERVQLAINTIEGVYLKSCLGQENYIDLIENPTSATNYILLNGGVLDEKSYVGLKTAIAYMVWCWLVTNSYTLTRYGGVVKSSEYSDNKARIDVDDLMFTARRNWEWAIQMVKEVMLYYNLDITHNIGPDVFNTIVY